MADPTAKNIATEDRDIFRQMVTLMQTQNIELRKLRRAFQNWSRVSEPFDDTTNDLQPPTK